MVAIVRDLGSYSVGILMVGFLGMGADIALGGFYGLFQRFIEFGVVHCWGNGFRASTAGVESLEVVEYFMMLSVGLKLKLGWNKGQRWKRVSHKKLVWQMDVGTST